MKKRLIVTMLVGIMLLSNIGVAAHHGGGHSYSGHQNSYYNCGGHQSHLHNNGSCPYSTTSSTTTKAIQQKLNDLGHDCGIADGVMGRKTKSAIKAFQKAQGLTVDGVVGTATKKALGV